MPTNSNVCLVRGDALGRQLVSVLGPLRTRQPSLAWSDSLAAAGQLFDARWNLACCQTLATSSSLLQAFAAWMDRAWDPAEDNVNRAHSGFAYKSKSSLCSSVPRSCHS